MLQKLLIQALKKVVAQTPYRVLRAGAVNRFDAIEETLLSLVARGYRPRIVVDGGANVGDFSRMASRVFPESVFHLIEPQPQCHTVLERLAASRRFTLHAAALGAEDGEITLAITEGAVTTGAHVIAPGCQTRPQATAQVPVRRLDAILNPETVAGGSNLLKLDLQGWELEALKGAEKRLPYFDVILCEVSFYAQAYEPPIVELLHFLDARGFDLHDIAAIAARPRDNRPRQGDFLFARRGSALMADTAWS